MANSVLVGEDTIVMVEYPVELGCLPHVIGREDGGVLIGVRNRRYGRTVSLGSVSSLCSLTCCNKHNNSYNLINLLSCYYQVIAMYIVNPTGDLELAESRSEEFININ